MSLALIKLPSPPKFVWELQHTSYAVFRAGLKLIFRYTVANVVFYICYACYRPPSSLSLHAVAAGKSDFDTAITFGLTLSCYASEKRRSGYAGRRTRPRRTFGAMSYFMRDAWSYPNFGGIVSFHHYFPLRSTALHSAYEINPKYRQCLSILVLTSRTLPCLYHNCPHPLRKPRPQSFPQPISPQTPTSSLFQGFVSSQSTTMSMHLATIRKWILTSPPAEWALAQLRSLLIGALRQGPVPRHVAFVMDGNRRFARNHRIETVEGHHLGFEALARILEVCYKSGITTITIYAFSIENFKRSKYEVDALMDMAKTKLSQLAQHGSLLERYGARIQVLGQRSLVKPDVLEAVDRAVELTKNNGRAILNICFPYTSHDEMTTAVRETVREYSRPIPRSMTEQRRSFSEDHIVHNIQARRLSTQGSPGALEAVRSHSPASSGAASDTEESLSSSATTLYPDSPPEDHLLEPIAVEDPDLLKPPPSSHTSHHNTNHSAANYPDAETINASVLNAHMFTAGLPPLDLLVRTSGVERLSDFMLWQCHEKTEIVFLSCLWPDFDLWSFLPVLVEWQWKRRRSGDRETERENLREENGRAKIKAA